MRREAQIDENLKEFPPLPPSLPPSLLPFLQRTRHCLEKYDAVQEHILSGLVKLEARQNVEGKTEALCQTIGHAGGPLFWCGVVGGREGGKEGVKEGEMSKAR